MIPMVCPRAMSCVGAVEGSRWLSVLFSPESLTMTVSVAASGAFRDRIRDVLRPHVEAAKASGELREQLDPDAVADWLVRATDAADGTPHHPARRDQARPPRAASRLRHPRHSEPDTRALTADGTRPFGWVAPHPESAPRGRGARTHKAADLVDGRKLWHRRDQRRWLREVYDAADLWARCSPTMPRLRLSTTRTSASSGPRWLPVTLSDKPRALSWSASASTPLAPSGCWQRFRKTPIRRCETLLSGLSTLQGNDNSSTRPPSVIRHHNSERNTGTREGSNRDAHHGGAELCKRSAPPDCATRRAPKVSPSPSASPYSRIHAMARSAATSSDGRSAAGSAPTTARQRRRP